MLRKFTTDRDRRYSMTFKIMSTSPRWPLLFPHDLRKFTTTKTNVWIR